MRTMAVVISLAISSIALWSDVTPASATKMNGNCCQSSDGGRSYRAKVALARLAIPRSCSAYAASCMRVAVRRGDGARLCLAAKAQCLQTGVHVGPYSGMQVAGMEKR
ncbi:hypothetical protein [uncultured Bradyrhizobium sp.]|uniref:hypothetical protein n=1 Tax=uncultured Bradyrhizobium sp. TaxID=199684 RepID=UPI0035CC2E90